MARCLIIACGCRGRELTGALRERGHAVRGTTRDPGHVAAIEAVGAEPVVADPDRVSTMFGAFAHVGVVCLLLGSATGSAESLGALYSTRLDMLMEKMTDTTVRGVVYEAVGSVDADLLASGAERVRWWCERSLIPYVLLDADRSDHLSWTVAAADAVETALLGRDQFTR